MTAWPRFKTKECLGMVLKLEVFSDYV